MVIFFDFWIGYIEKNTYSKYEEDCDAAGIQPALKSTFQCAEVAAILHWNYPVRTAMYVRWIHIENQIQTFSSFYRPINMMNEGR